MIFWTSSMSEWRRMGRRSRGVPVVAPKAGVADDLQTRPSIRLASRADSDDRVDGLGDADLVGPAVSFDSEADVLGLDGHSFSFARLR